MATLPAVDTSQNMPNGDVPTADSAPTADPVPKDPRKQSNAGSTSPSECDAVQLLRDFASQILSVKSIQDERDHLRKRLRHSEDLVVRAAVREASFPSITAQAKQKRDSCEENLKRIDEKLKTHLKLQDNIIQDLARGFSYGANQQKSEVEDLKQGLGKVESAISEIQKDAVKTKELQEETIQDLTQGFNNKVNQQKGDVEGLKQGLGKVQFVITDMREEHKKMTSIPEELISFQSKVHTLEAEFATLKADARQAKESLDAPLSVPHLSLQDLENRLDDLTARVNDPLKTDKQTSKPAEPKCRKDILVLNGDIKSLSTQIQNLRALQDSKDDDIADELETLHSLVKQSLDGLNKLRAEGFTPLQGCFDEMQSDIGEIRGSLTEIVASRLQPQPQPPENSIIQRTSQSPSTAPPPSTIPPSATIPQSDSTATNQHAKQKAIETQLMTMNQMLQNHNKGIYTSQVAIQSLENRYNHLTTEPIAKQVVVEMQEMYPYASTAQKEITELKHTVHHLSKTIQDVVKQMEDLMSRNETLIQGMNEEKDRLVQEIQENGAKVEDMERVTLQRLADTLTHTDRNGVDIQLMKTALNNLIMKVSRMSTTASLTGKTSQLSSNDGSQERSRANSLDISDAPRAPRAMHLNNAAHVDVLDAPRAPRAMHINTTAAPVNSRSLERRVSNSIPSPREDSISPPNQAVPPCNESYTPRETRMSNSALHSPCYESYKPLEQRVSMNGNHSHNPNRQKRKRSASRDDD
ncbi:hypothetical protein AJ80_04706 [Polytolypa hystricis UAMH7299]|uniref:Uncharacterized protein n=1 Tax=Polytolypa hystricis (strain UAMH7299) TaxID=1447883 RepID=A0A2B7Y9V2_POLH7|nr:hypothetical protein AJ80_04706 [Polytolypa hystricis UAMH7299]